MKLLVTGASGFIGSFVVEEALRRGDEVWAAVRASSSRRYLRDTRIHLLELDFSSPQKLQAALQAAGCMWQVVVHCAGVTKCKGKQDFVEGNYRYTKNLVEALLAVGIAPTQFVYLSSLSVLGAIHECDDAPLSDTDRPKPNTAYGQSKLMAERYLESLPQFPYVILRPTGVYGPRERDYYLMARSVKCHIDLAVGRRRQQLTFIFVQDLVQAIFCVIEKRITRRSFVVSDGGVYSSSDFSNHLAQFMGVRGVLRVTLPLWVLWAVCVVSAGCAACIGKSSTLNGDKYRIMKQRNWRCDITPLMREAGYVPCYPLERGVKETVIWYLAQKWL